MGQTVNLLAYAFGGSNPSLPTLKESLHIDCVMTLFSFIYSYSHCSYKHTLSIPGNEKSRGISSLTWLSH